ncbi:MAG: hypothetical protein MZV70_08900 [Desulfobacterales bacterium]|nr:hypothetical protein [Desulfobacterales bacterium]
MSLNEIDTSAYNPADRPFDFIEEEGKTALVCEQHPLLRKADHRNPRTDGIPDHGGGQRAGCPQAHALPCLRHRGGGRGFRHRQPGRQRRPDLPGTPRACPCGATSSSP